MRLIIQRVKSAKVTTEEEIVGEIGKGLFILLGVGHEDKTEYAKALAEKIANMRLMSDSNGKINLSVKDTGAEILLVSQFTLMADTNYGRRPSFVKAADPELAREVYNKLIEGLKSESIKVETGRFGSYMSIEAELDGPVTITLEYPGNV